MLSFTTISKKIAEAPRVDFSDLFNESVAVFKKVWLQGFLVQLITVALSLPLVIFNFSILSESGLDLDSNEFVNKIFIGGLSEQQLGPKIIVYYLLSIVVAIVSSVLNFGFFRLIKLIDMGEEFKISDVFYFFKKGRFTNSLLLLFANLGVVILAILMFILPIFYVMIPLMFLTPFFVFNPELSISEILKSSFALGHKKWGITFAITILNIITLYILVLLTCGLGSMFFACFLQMPIYVLYKKIISFENS